MKKAAKLMSLLMVSLMAFTTAAGNVCVSAAEEADAETPTLDAIRERGKLIVGTSADYPPYEFHTEIDGEDTIVGFEIACAQYFADSLGVDLELVDMPFDSLLISLGKGDFDLVMAGMAPDDTRRKAADFTDNFFNNQEMIMVRAEDADQYKKPEDLIGHKAGAQTGSVMMEELTAIIGEEDAIGLVKNQDLVMELKSGKIDAIYTNTIAGKPYAAANDDLELVDIGLPSDPGFASATQKGNDDLIDYLNTLIQELKDSGLMDQYVIEAQELAGVE